MSQDKLPFTIRNAKMLVFESEEPLSKSNSIEIEFENFYKPITKFDLK
jgi:hypothetical protein